MMPLWTKTEAKNKGSAKAGSAPALALLYMLDVTSNPDHFPLVLKRLAPGSGVIIRGHTQQSRYTLAQLLRPLCQRHRLHLLIAGTPFEALRARAQGIHLNRQATKKRLYYKAYKKRWFTTAAAHGYAELNAAARAGAQSVCLSPVFATPSHPEARPLGVVRFGLMQRSSALPVLALGGITHKTAARLVGVKPYGFAGISIWQANMPVNSHSV
jgi:thiamine-phosphate pyrophosphorylase